MKTAFFTSSVGDTDLAKATAAQLLLSQAKPLLHFVPLANAAATRTEEYREHTQIKRTTLPEMIGQEDALTKKKLSEDELDKIKAYVKEHQIQQAYIGVTSDIHHEVPFQIAEVLDIPCVLAYEYMFKPDPHVFWQYAQSLATKKNIQFAVPLKKAADDILPFNPLAQVNVVGHLCIDRSQELAPFDKAPVKKALAIHDEEELAFISGTTQPTHIDNQFLEALLSELSTGKYPKLQIRFGLHPGVNNLTDYLKTLLKTCDQYPNAQKHFKIVLTEALEKKLTEPGIKEHSYIMRCNVSGPDMGKSADRVAQSVPGALLNEAALAGKPCYFHQKTTMPYLPESWFSKHISDFFSHKPEKPRDPKELELSEPVCTSVAKLLS